MSPVVRALVPLLVSVLAVASCKQEIVPEAYVPTGAHDAYRHGLAQAGLDRTALGRDWAKAASLALRSPTEVETPFAETFHVDPAEAFAIGYRFTVRRGQRTEVKLEIDPTSEWRIFLDLFRAPEAVDEVPEPVATGGEGDLRLAFEPRRDGVYLLRVQSELLRGGTCSLVIRNVASLEFPVEGSGSGAIGSSFGAPREGGRRAHHGVDIFAPRGTAVLATSRARVRRVAEWKLGGRVVWLEDPERDLRLYFAHLDTQDVVEGTWVSPGDRIGTVGNSGNARTTPPHLHFGIYVRGEGPIDPYPFLFQPSQAIPSLRADRSSLGAWVRTGSKSVPLTAGPRRESAPLRELSPGTPLRVLGATGSKLRVELSDGMSGFIPFVETDELQSRPGLFPHRRHGGKTSPQVTVE
ncbi:MAG TPA: M23 family metallopeptidase [Vicinamibacteria bacterium]|nr:M23 family metallopeptidase [Vicinamibacteria bacterium]